MIDCTLCKKPIVGARVGVDAIFCVDGRTRYGVAILDCCETCASAFCSVSHACADLLRRKWTSPERKPAPKPPSLLGRLHDTVCGALLWLCDRG